MLEQKIGTPFQQKWLTKLLGYDFRVEYKRGKENKIVDALSRKDETPNDAILSAISFPTTTLLDNLGESYHEDST